MTQSSRFDSSDILVRYGYALDAEKVRSDGVVRVRNGKLVEHLESEAWKDAGEASVVGNDRSFVTPGLFNAHTHAAMNFFRDRCHGAREMVERLFFPAEAKLEPSLLRDLSLPFLWEAVATGTTSIADHYYFIDGVADAVEEFGLRGFLGEMVADQGGAHPGEKAWERAESFRERAASSQRLTAVCAPHAADTVSAAWLERSASWAQKHDLPIHLHLSQSPGEVKRVRASESISPVELAERSGVLGSRTQAVHLTNVSEGDLGILSRTGTTAGFCASSQVIYNQLAPIDSFVSHSIPFSLGTDCNASNDTADLLAEARVAALFAEDRLRANSTSEESVERWLGHPFHLPELMMSAVTTVPARVFSKQKLGTLENGAVADLALYQPSLGSLPVQEPGAHWLYSLSARDLDRVMVDGHWVWKDGRSTLVDEAEATKRYESALKHLQGRL